MIDLDSEWVMWVRAAEPLAWIAIVLWAFGLVFTINHKLDVLLARNDAPEEGE